MNLTASVPGRRVLFGGYYFVEGAPIGFLWWTLPSVLQADGVGSDRIGALLGWLVLPWAFKWLWAPVVDRFQGPRWTLRAWITSAQIGMALALLPLLLDGGRENFALLAGCLGLHALFASTQDAAIDGLMIRCSSPGERGRLAGWMQAGMLTSRALLGGGALLLLPILGGRAIIGALLAIIVCGLGLGLLYRAPPVDAAARPPGVVGRRLGPALRDALRARTTWAGLAFAALAGAGFEAVGAFAGPLLTELSGGSTDLAGRFFLVHAVLGMVGGGLAGGVVTDRLGAARSTCLAGILLALSIFALALAIERLPVDEPAALIPWLTACYVMIGAFTSASYALFMAWTDARIGATHFSAFMGATNLCEAWSAVAAGRIIAAHGHGPAFATLAGVGVAALLLVPVGRPGRLRPDVAPSAPSTSPETP